MRYAIFSTVIFAGLLAQAIYADAAEVRVITNGHTLGIGASFEATISVDTQGENLNAFEGAVRFPSDLLTPLEVREGSSIVNFWIERPRASTTGNIRFSGITPGGFAGRGTLFSVIFRTSRSGNGAIDVIDSRILRGDEDGIQARVVSVGAQVAVSSAITTIESVPYEEDTDPPEPFTPAITRDQSLLGGKYVLIFATQDKKSGIDRYEVCEGDIRHCVAAESPYVLHYQNLGRNIFIKAIDRAGNERLAKLPLLMHLLWPQALILIGILGAFVWMLFGSFRRP
mgnify:CR=1 FL=1